MDSATLRQRITKKLLHEIEEVQFPSSAMLNRVEERLVTYDDVAGYANALAERVEATRFPSVDLMRRIDRLAERLERAERR
jgi:hypothetical protein